jgi:hypothetical protein
MAENGGQSSFIKYVSNPKAFTMKRWFFEMLGDEYAAHDTIVERAATALTTDKDLEDFGRLISKVYECGFRRAAAEYAKEAEKLGLTVRVVTPPAKPS